ACGKRVEVRGDWGGGERRAHLSRAFEAQGQSILCDSNVVEAGLFQQFLELVGVRHAPRSGAIAIRELVAGPFPDGVFEGCEGGRLLDVGPYGDSYAATDP